MTADARGGEAPAGVPDEGAPWLRLLAHELRNYIAPMHNAMHLLRLKARADATLGPVIDMVERQLVAMSGTLDAVGEVDRLQRGEVTLERTPTSLQALAERAVQSLPSTARRDRIDVVVPRELPLLDLDAPRVTRVIASLLDNALRYARGDSPVQVRAQETADSVEISVDDRGPGMPPEERQRALQFFALPHKAGHGMGLGLPLAASIMRLHGGSLLLDEPQGGGLRVVLRFARPDTQTGGMAASRETAQAQQAEGAASSSLAPGRRVLLADDNAAVRASLTDLLEEMGHEVRAVADGAQAVSMAQAWQPDFVLLDVHMPKLNGFEAARKLRALYPASTMQLVMMSGDGLDEVVRQGARQAGFDHCVDKGLAIGELAAVLARPRATGGLQ